MHQEAVHIAVPVVLGAAIEGGKQHGHNARCVSCNKLREGGAVEQHQRTLHNLFYREM